MENCYHFLIVRKSSRTPENHRSVLEKPCSRWSVSLNYITTGYRKTSSNRNLKIKKTTKLRATSPINLEFATFVRSDKLIRVNTQVMPKWYQSPSFMWAPLCCCFLQTCHLSHSKMYISCTWKCFLPWLSGFRVVDQKRTLRKERLPYEKRYRWPPVCINVTVHEVPTQ